MDPVVISVVVLGCTFGGAFAGMRLRARLPGDHLSDESRHTVNMGIGLVATMTALVLGLVTASAKSSFDAMSTQVKQTAADVLSLNRALARYGPEALEIRRTLKLVVRDRIEYVRDPGPVEGTPPDPASDAPGVESIAARIKALAPATEEQRWILARALDLGESLFERRWLMFAGQGSSVPAPFLGILVFWLTITFASYGLFAPRNATVIVVLLVCALSVAGAVFLVLEMDSPFQGWIRVSTEPLAYAIAHMNA